MVHARCLAQAATSPYQHLLQAASQAAARALASQGLRSKKGSRYPQKLGPV